MCSLPEQVMLILDEAYVEFARENPFILIRYQLLTKEYGCTRTRSFCVPFRRRMD